MRKHVDAIALLVILLGFLAFTKAPDSRVFNRVAIRIQNRIQNKIERIESTRFREVVNYSIPRFH